MKYKSVNDPACDGCVPRAQARQRRAGGGGGRRDESSRSSQVRIVTPLHMESSSSV